MSSMNSDELASLCIQKLTKEEETEKYYKRLPCMHFNYNYLTLAYVYILKSLPKKKQVSLNL